MDHREMRKDTSKLRFIYSEENGSINRMANEKTRHEMIYTQNEHFEPKVMEMDGSDEFPFQTQPIFRFQPGSFPFKIQGTKNR